MKRLIEKIVFCGLVTAWRLATVPTRRSPELVNATTEGVVRPPSAFSITVGSPRAPRVRPDANRKRCAGAERHRWVPKHEQGVIKQPTRNRSRASGVSPDT